MMKVNSEPELTWDEDLSPVLQEKMNGSLLPLFLKAIMFDGSTAVTMKAYDFPGVRGGLAKEYRYVLVKTVVSKKTG